jgi:signal transduction histidine kinase
MEPLLCSTVLSSLGKVILERQPDGTFLQSGEGPDWFRRLNSAVFRSTDPIRVESLFPFLEVFFTDAGKVCEGNGVRRLESDLWCETTADGEELPLEATALCAGPRRLLVITRCDELFRERRLLLQRARELRFTYDALSRETEQKDILMHCIVHDLASPLQTVLGVLSSLSEQELAEEDGLMVKLALDAALRQRSMIREILSVFAAEHGEMDAAREVTAVSELQATLARVSNALEVMARGRKVTIERDAETAPCLVIADEARLIRVVSNLLENAIRHSPVGGRVWLKTREEDNTVEVSIRDEGSGVPPSVAPQLFQRFGRGTGVEAGTGLGLYFCRITVERWGGSIGYEGPSDEKGPRFWFRLRKVPAGVNA